MSASASSSSKPLAPGAPLPPSLQMLYQKQQEYAALQALKEASEALVTRADRLAEMSTTMAEGGESIGRVLQNWHYIFSLLEQVGQANPYLNTSGEGESDPLPMMVRLPYKGEEGVAADEESKE